MTTDVKDIANVIVLMTFVKGRRYLKKMIFKKIRYDLQKICVIQKI